MKRVDLIKTGGFAAGENLATSDVSSPEPAEGEVVIEVKASAVNPVDWKMAEMGFLLPETLPAALGCDVSGVVVKASVGNEHWIGKRVLTYLGANKGPRATNRGGFVQQVAAHAEVIYEIPDGVSFTDAATLPVGAFTAILLLDNMPMTKGSHILIWGASSSVGFNAVQLAVRRGLKVIAVASGKHESRLQELGIAGFVDYRKNDVESKVKKLCAGSNLNGALDCIGVPDSFGMCAKLVKELGDPSLALTVSTVSPWGLPDPPEGVAKIPVNFGMKLDDEEGRMFLKKNFPEVLQLKSLPIRFVKGPVAAETVEEAFQICKDGVSGEKIVIEWTE